VSLVEQALKKLKDSRPAVSSDAPQRIDSAPVAIPVRSGNPVPRRNHAVLEVDRNSLRRAGLFPPESEERRMSAEYRQIKRPLIAAALGKGTPKVPNGSVIMVASALPGDGKTFTSTNLAISMALEKDITVLLVDADLAKPHISRTFGVADRPGLLDLLRDGSIDAESLILETNISGLQLLPAGHNTESATELLASNRMEQIVANLVKRDENRIILFDSPPLLLTSESRVLAHVAGQTVLVVRAGVTRQQAVFDALACLGEGKPVGIVLNQSHAAQPGSYYAYGQYGDSTSVGQSGS
jgi:protein-tyrosine kinase